MQQKLLGIAGVLAAAALVLALAGCPTVGSVVSDAIADSVSSSASSAASDTASKTVATADFKSGELLAATEEGSPLLENHYKAAKVLKPASEQTKNQAEVLIVGTGEKLWTEFLIPSHKAKEEEIQLGMNLLYHEWAGYENIDPEDYRKGRWYIGTVSNTDEMFKGLIEVNGDRMYLRWLRVADQPLEE